MNSQGGSIIIPDVDNGQAVNGFTAHLRLLVGGGSTPPADGISFVWVNDLPVGTVFGEDGSGTGLIISFDIYNNGNETPPAPSIDVRYSGQTVATVQMPYQQMETGDTFADFLQRVEGDDTLDLHYKNSVLFNNVQLPGYAPMTDASFGIGGRTGGLNENQWIDSMEITTTIRAAPSELSISKDANGRPVIRWSGAGVLESAGALPATTWNTVANATSPFLVDPTAPMRFYRLRQ